MCSPKSLALAGRMTDPELRKGLVAGARAPRQILPDWPTTGARFAAALEERFTAWAAQ